MQTHQSEVNEMLDDFDIAAENHRLQTVSFSEIIDWALARSAKPVVTTNFGPHEASLLHAVTRNRSTIPVIWCDSGYNTKATYEYVETLRKQLKLNLQTYVPQQTRAHRDIVMGEPELDNELFSLFTEQVKLEPFSRAMKDYQPDVWFTNLRQGQTSFRDSIGILSRSADGVLKVSPFYHCSDADLDGYLETYALPNESNYYDPTKVFSNRECGLHYAVN